MRLEGMAEILGNTDRKSSENVLQIQQSLSCTKFWQKNCHYIGNTVKAKNLYVKLWTFFYTNKQSKAGKFPLLYIIAQITQQQKQD